MRNPKGLSVVPAGNVQVVLLSLSFQPVKSSVWSDGFEISIQSCKWPCTSLRPD
jgi:hypothetical protein